MLKMHVSHHRLILDLFDVTLNRKHNAKDALNHPNSTLQRASTPALNLLLIVWGAG